MNYKRAYYRLLNRALVRDYQDGMFMHHVIPRYVGREYDILVPVTAKEHVVIHRLLYKAFGGIHYKSLFTYHLMTRTIGYKTLLAGKNHPAYGIPKPGTSEKLTGIKRSAETRAKMSKASTGRRHSEETKARISATMTGRPGSPHTEETKARMSKAHTGMKKPWAGETNTRLKSHPCVFKGIEFDSMTQASKHFGVHRRVLLRWIDEGSGYRKKKGI